MDMNNFIDSESLTKWQDTISETPKFDPEEDHCSIDKSPFPFNAAINNRITYWVGNIWNLKADAIVCCQNEDAKADQISKYTLLKAGNELNDEYMEFVKRCKGGEVKLTKGYQLPSAYIIHTIAPRYSPKYFTAAETALHNSYRNVLMAAEENTFAKLGLRCIHSSVCKYPSFSGAHVALRTIRRFLESHQSIKLITLVVSNNNRDAYDTLLPLYFPRNEGEERVAAVMLPSNTGDQHGQLYLPERQIRINPRPAKQNDALVSSRESEQDQFSNETLNIAQEEPEFKVSQIDETFLKARESVDKERVRKIAEGTDSFNYSSLRRQIYKRLLLRAHKEDFSKLFEKRFLYQSGEDRNGRVMVVFLAQRWVGDTYSQPSSPKHDTQLLREKLQLFFINQLDSVANHKYNFLYVQSMGDKKTPSSECLQALFNVLDPKYMNNLENLFILHCTSLLSRWRTLYRHPSFLNDKTTFLKGIEHLWTFIAPDRLDLPECVLANDLNMHGVRYYNG